MRYERVRRLPGRDSGRLFVAKIVLDGPPETAAALVALKHVLEPAPDEQSDVRSITPLIAAEQAITFARRRNYPGVVLCGGRAALTDTVSQVLDKPGILAAQTTDMRYQDYLQAAGKPASGPEADFLYVPLPPDQYSTPLPPNVHVYLPDQAIIQGPGRIAA